MGRPNAGRAALHAEHVHGGLGGAEEPAEAQEGADGHGRRRSPVLGEGTGSSLGPSTAAWGQTAGLRAEHVLNVQTRIHTDGRLRDGTGRGVSNGTRLPHCPPRAPLPEPSWCHSRVTLPSTRTAVPTFAPTLGRCRVTPHTSASLRSGVGVPSCRQEGQRWVPGQRPRGRAVESPGVLPRGEDERTHMGPPHAAPVWAASPAATNAQGPGGEPCWAPRRCQGACASPAPHSPWLRKGQAAGALSPPGPPPRTLPHLTPGS